jgi:hypothetical protein
VRSFTVINCEQRSAEWRAARAGVLTASRAAAMLSHAKRGGEEPVGKSNLRTQLALETVRGVPIDDDPFESNYMREGREREPEARATYEAESGLLLQTVGFLRHATLPIGCSPDAIVGDFEGGIELKCPKFTTHWRYVKKGVLPSEYVAQVTHSLYVTGLAWWDFCSYCPEFDDIAPLFRVRVTRDAVDLDAYALAFRLFWNEVEREIAEMQDRAAGTPRAPETATADLSREPSHA